MNFFIFFLFLDPIYCDEINSNEIISKQQLNLFRNITGINDTEAQFVWRKVEEGIMENRKRRSADMCNVLPKFRYEVTDVKSVSDFQFSNIDFKRQNSGVINPIRWNKEVIKEGIIFNSGVVIVQKPGLYYVSIGARNPYDNAELGLTIRLNNEHIVYADK